MEAQKITTLDELEKAKSIISHLEQVGLHKSAVCLHKELLKQYGDIVEKVPVRGLLSYDCSKETVKRLRKEAKRKKKNEAFHEEDEEQFDEAKEVSRRDEEEQHKHSTELAIKEIEREARALQETTTAQNKENISEASPGKTGKAKANKVKGKTKAVKAGKKEKKNSEKTKKTKDKKKKKKSKSKSNEDVKVDYNSASSEDLEDAVKKGQHLAATQARRIELERKAAIEKERQEAASPSGNEEEIKKKKKKMAEKLAQKDQTSRMEAAAPAAAVTSSSQMHEESPPNSTKESDYKLNVDASVPPVRRKSISTASLTDEEIPRENEKARKKREKKEKKAAKAAKKAAKAKKKEKKEKKVKTEPSLSNAPVSTAMEVTGNNAAVEESPLVIERLDDESASYDEKTVDTAEVEEFSEHSYEEIEVGSRYEEVEVASGSSDYEEVEDDSSSYEEEIDVDTAMESDCPSEAKDKVAELPPSPVKLKDSRTAFNERLEQQANQVSALEKMMQTSLTEVYTFSTRVPGDESVKDSE